MYKRIQFRGKSLKTKKYVYGLYFTGVNDKKEIIHYIRSYSDDKKGYLDYEIDVITLGQFTGKKNNKSKRIFEGCVCKLEDTYKGRIKTVIKKIRWCSVNGVWLFGNEPIFDYDVLKFEIISDSELNNILSTFTIKELTSELKKRGFEGELKDI